MASFQLPFSVKTLNPVLLHEWAGPYSGADETTAKAAANAAIPSGVRLVGLEVILIIAGVAFKYAYKTGIADTDLLPFGGGGTNRVVSSVNTNTTAGVATDTDYVYLVSGTTTITLPTAVGNKNTYTIKRVGTDPVSIATTSSETIDGSSSPITINVQYVSITLISDGITANWNII